MRNLISIVLGVFIAAAACAGHSGQTGGEQSAATRACDGEIYDACTDGSECESGDCKLFSNREITVCTQSCDATHPCPDQDGQPVWCNNMGVCRPLAPNACSL